MINSCRPEMEKNHCRKGVWLSEAKQWAIARRGALSQQLELEQRKSAAASESENAKISGLALEPHMDFSGSIFRDSKLDCAVSRLFALNNIIKVLSRCLNEGMCLMRFSSSGPSQATNRQETTLLTQSSQSRRRLGQQAQDDSRSSCVRLPSSQFRKSPINGNRTKQTA